MLKKVQMESFGGNLSFLLELDIRTRFVFSKHQAKFVGVAFFLFSRRFTTIGKKDAFLERKLRAAVDFASSKPFQ